MFDPFQNVAVFDLCSGIGGFTLGSSSLGMETLWFLDHNQLVCDALRVNFSLQVIPGSVPDVQCIRELRFLKTHDFLQITGGFPVNHTRNRVTSRDSGMFVVPPWQLSCSVRGSSKQMLYS